MSASDAEHYREYFHRAQEMGLVDERDSAVIFYDLSVLARQAGRVSAAFDQTSVHAVAIKTNPLMCVLQEVAKLGHYGETASFEEMAIGHAAGLENRLIWDSAAKTSAEIDDIHELKPFLINVDSLEELQRYQNVGPFRLGLRVNPEVQPDAIASLSVGHSSSKFGIPISRKADIIDAFCANENLVGLHVHSSSNSRSLEPLADGIAKVLQLANEISAERKARGIKAQISYIDIGGGLPLADPENSDLSVESYAVLLRKGCPELFSGRYKIITEFGRYYHGAAGWTVSRIEYVHNSQERNDLVIHVGADHFVREVYDAEHWPLRFELIAQDPEPRPQHEYGIAGPLCFEGDRLGRAISLPEARPGDHLVIRHVGANNYSLWSRHCSRAFPKVIVYHSDKRGAKMRIGKQRENINDIIRFWS